jgi:tetratricopeptide (TPR) repeat protein
MIIKNIGGAKGIDYDLKYDPNSWNSKMKEHFKIGEIIGGVHCFIKRYDKSVPTANVLLNRLVQDTSNGIAVSNLPKVYDLAERIEGQKRVYYYVTECLEGDTLDAFFKKTPVDTINLKLMYLHLSKAFKEIHDRQFWFSDFNDQNILYNPDLPRFYLIDVDSAWSKEDKPTGDTALKGGLPGASLRYAALVEMLYREKLGQPKFNYNQLNGNSLNYLQLLTFVAHLRYYRKLQQKDKRLPFGQSMNQGILIEGIYQVDPILCRSVFDKAAQREPDFAFLNDLGKLADKVIAFEGWGGDKPRITRFEASANQIAKGQSTRLYWAVDDATEIELKGEDWSPKKVIAKGNQDVTINRNSTFTLIAQNSQGRVEQQVSIQLSPSAQSLEIISFKSSIVQEEQKVNRGETVHLTWIVLGHKENGVLFDKDVVANRGKRSVTPYKTTTYTLSATDAQSGAVQEKLTIIVQQNTPVWKWALIAFAAVSCLVGGYIGIENYRIDTIPMEQALNEGKTAYNNQSYRKSMRLMARCIDKNVNKAQAYYWRGLTAFKQGNHGEGCKDIEQAALLLPTDRNVKEACIQKCNCK